MIRLEGIDRVFKVGDEEVHALRDINLRFPDASYVALMGPSGSGKSTLLNILGLLDRPSSGRYLLDDLIATDLDDDAQSRARRHKIGFVFQSFHLVPRLSAAENVELPLVLAGVEPVRRREKVQAALAALNLSDRARHRPDQLSGGQRQRVAIARATIMQPEVILADEPTGNLDRASGQAVLETLEALHRKGITVIIVTHDPEIGQRAERRIHMADGRIMDDSRISP
jgi:putative ABC transport system ATP-binding protein